MGLRNGSIFVNLVLYALSVPAAYAQSDDKTNESASVSVTAPSDHRQAMLFTVEHIGAYVAPEIKYTPRNILIAGWRAAVIFNRTFALGGAGYCEFNAGCFGGLLGEYSWWTELLVHPRIGLLAGAGGTMGGACCGMRTRSQANSRIYAVLEPEISADLNLFRYLRGSLGGGYRFQPGLNKGNPAIRGPFASLSVRAGIF